MDLILATNNKNKVREMRSMLGESSLNILSLSEAGITVDIEETGNTFAENAFIKASAVARLTGKISLADDSGLEVDFLGGKPGIHSARFAGEEHNDEKNIEKLLLLMENTENRDCSFTSVLCLCKPDGTAIYTEGKTYGKILRQKEGNNGFGYDPVFFSVDLQKSFGVCSEEEKNGVSHRGRAVQKMVTVLKNLF